jgi:hypothetical protein
VPENVSLSYRGANYAIGQGQQFYGIWQGASIQTPPLEWWPHTPEGWSAAWARFVALEVPGTIAPVSEPTAGPETARAAAPETARAAAPETARAAGPAADGAHAPRDPRIAAGLLLGGVALGVVGLFPTYIDGSSLAQQPFQVVPHAIYLAAWSLSAVLIVLGGVRQRVGALLGVGMSAVTLGLFFADAGTPIAGGAHLMGAGLVLSILGWLACTAGAVVAVGLGPVGKPSFHRLSHEIVPTVTLMLAALGAAIAFAPSWDTFTLRTAAGLSTTVTEGNAFANPAPVIIGDVVVMIALIAVALAAAFWRPIRLGAALVAGAIIPMVAQAISAVVQLSEPISPLQFGISPTQAAQSGLTITAGLTPMFWIFCTFVGALILLSVWMLVGQDSITPAASRWQSLNSAVSTDPT